MNQQQRIYPAGRDYSEHGIERGQRIKDFAELKVGDVVVRVSHRQSCESAFAVKSVTRHGAKVVYYGTRGCAQMLLVWDGWDEYYKAIPAQTEPQTAPHEEGMT